MKVLLTTTSFLDAHALSHDTKSRDPNSILSILAKTPVDKIFACTLPGMQDIAKQVALKIKQSHPRTQIEQIAIDVGCGTKEKLALSAIKEASSIISASLNNNDTLFLHAAQTTSAIHQAWDLMLKNNHIQGMWLGEESPKELVKQTYTLTEAASPDELFIDDIVESLGLIGNHSSFRSAIEMTSLLAEHNVPVIFQGETSTGKQTFARLLHKLSPRRNRPLVTVHCSTLPSNKSEDSLLSTHNGTLFLNEIDALPAQMQAKLLHILEKSDANEDPHSMDIRIIAATDKNLLLEVKEGRFRQDLYYKLCLGKISLPSLSDRSCDIPLIALAHLGRVNRSLCSSKRLSPRSVESLMQVEWPGNIQDLHNVVERAALLCPKDLLEPKDLFPEGPEQDAADPFPMPFLKEGFSLEAYISNLRVKIINKALDQSEGNQSKAARLLGVSPQAVNKFIKRELVEH